MAYQAKTRCKPSFPPVFSFLCEPNTMFSLALNVSRGRFNLFEQELSPVSGGYMSVKVSGFRPKRCLLESEAV